MTCGENEGGALAAPSTGGDSFGVIHVRTQRTVVGLPSTLSLAVYGSFPYSPVLVSSASPRVTRYLAVEIEVHHSLSFPE